MRLSQVTDEKQITIVTSHDAERSLLRAEVADTGQGIEPGDFRRLFEPYFSRRDSGTGLGLAIVQRIILEHGGQIRAERNDPRGARFVIELPTALMAIAKLSIVNAEWSANCRQGILSKIDLMDSILIVDDERGIRDTLRAVMEDEGFVADAVATGEECLKALGRRAYGCILLDVWLPGIDGLETLKQLREAGSDAAVVIISGHGNIETAVRATKLGAFDFIEKPLSIEKTVLTVRNALRQQRLELINADMAAALAREYTMVGESVAMRALRKADLGRRAD